jgi:hypothetical protein
MRRQSAKCFIHASSKLWTRLEPRRRLVLFARCPEMKRHAVLIILAGLAVVAVYLAFNSIEPLDPDDETPPIRSQ